MLRLKTFRPTNEKIVKIQLHPTHPWMVTADASDRVCVWNWEHRQVQRCIFFLYSLPIIYVLLISNCFLSCCIACFLLLQVIYELKAGGVDERRLVGAKLEKLAEGETGSILFGLARIVVLNKLMYWRPSLICFNMELTHLRLLDEWGKWKHKFHSRRTVLEYWSCITVCVNSDMFIF